jgi:hypothetical protein
MNTNNRKSNSFISWLPYLVFFAVSFIYFAFFGNYISYYQEKSSLFIFSADFLYENLHQPGGFLIWFGKFFTTFYYNPVIGAILLSAFLTLVIILASGIISLLTGKKYSLIPFIIGVSLFYLQTDYRFMLFNILGILLELTFFLIAVKYRSFLKGWLPFFLMPFCYCVTGGFLWIFLLCMTLYLALYKENNRGIRIIVLWLVTLVTFYLSKEFIFFQSGKTLMTFPFTNIITGSQRIMFLSVAGIISILPVLAKTKIRLPGKPVISEFSLNLIASFLVVIIVVIIGVQRFDVKTKQYFCVEKLFYEDKFDEVIAFNTLNPTNNSLTIFLNNIALCETDKLNDLLFHFPQSSDGKTLFLKWEMIGEILDRGGYFYYTIGMINEAHRWAFENIVMKGLTPEDLKMLIKTDLINGNYKVASKYINILKNTAFYNKEAKAFEKLLFNDVAISTDPDLGEKRQNKIGTDFFSITDDPYINIERILLNDSLNKKAFEYKLAFMLLKKNYPGIAKELPKFESYGFTKFPVHIEEAMEALSVMNKDKLLIPGKLQISNDTETRWTQYLTVFQQYGTDPKASEPALRKQFGNTFWYWAFYR